MRVLSDLDLVNRAPARRRAANATFSIGVQGRFVVNGDFLPWADITQRNEEDVLVKNLHKGIGLTRVIYIVGTVTATTTVETPPIIDRADP